MRLLECASLLFLSAALIALTLRMGSLGWRRVLFGVTAFTMGLQALIEGARWQLAPAYVLVAIGVVRVLGPGTPPRAHSKILSALRIGLSVIALFVAVLLPALIPVPSFPAPGGPYPVGTVTFVLEDRAREDAGEPGRPRRLLAQAWYPADASAARTPRTPYMPDVTRTGPALCRAFGLPPFFLNHLAYALSHSHGNAAFSPSVGRAPLLIMSHGFRFTRTMSTTTAEELASRGYVVVALEHTYDAAAVAFPDGTIALTKERPPKEMTEEEEVSAKTSSILVRAADVRFLLDVLSGAPSLPIPEVLAGHIDASRVGVFGHSLGGGTAAEVCRSDARVTACENLDGQIYGEARESGEARPFLHVENEGRGGASDAFIGRLRGPACRVRAARMAHLDFTDVPLILPAMPYLLPRPGRKNAGGEEALRAMNQLVTAFFDATLRGDQAAWSRVRDPLPPFSSTCERLPAP
jgi:predicted dienelactone hydrolase